MEPAAGDAAGRAAAALAGVAMAWVSVGGQAQASGSVRAVAAVAQLAPAPVAQAAQAAQLATVAQAAQLATVAVAAAAAAAVELPAGGAVALG